MKTTSSSVSRSRLSEALHADLVSISLADQLLGTEGNLQATAEEWVADYQDNPHHALAQLINFILRVSEIGVRM